jgi:hypothetical protein
VFAPVSERSAPLSLPAEQTELTVKRTSRRPAFHLLAVVIVAALGTGLAAYKYEHRALMNDQDRVVVAAFTNSTGNADLDGTFSSALQSQLQQSPYINLIPETDFTRWSRAQNQHPFRMNSAPASNLMDRCF